MAVHGRPWGGGAPGRAGPVGGERGDRCARQRDVRGRKTAPVPKCWRSFRATASRWPGRPPARGCSSDGRKVRMADPSSPEGPSRTGPPAAHDFDLMYSSSVPPWDIGRPQPAFEELARSGCLSGKVLDVGCGTGEHALLAAALGHEALGVDIAPRAIEQAEAKAAARGLEVRFLVRDALLLPELGEQFDTVLDCGLFHVLDDADRVRFVRQLGCRCTSWRPLSHALFQRPSAWRRGTTPNYTG